MGTHLYWAAVGCAALGACSPSASQPSGVVPQPDGAAPATDGAAPATVTYYQDVAPILQAKCTPCHKADGIAPFALETPEQARSQAGLIKLVTALGHMPPWPPGPLSPAMRHDRRLSPQQIATLAAWADAGAPLGDAANPAPAAAPDVVDIQAPDLTIDIGVDYVPDTSLTDDYRCFLVDPGIVENRMVIGYRVTPGNPKTVHHVITTLFPATDRAELVALDAQSPERSGWPCVGGPVPTDSPAKPDGSLGGWAPGTLAVVMPEGTGSALHAGDMAVIQVHYNLLGGHDPDRTKVAVKLAPKGTEATLQQLATIRLLKRALQIPANQGDVVQEATLPARTWTLGKFYPDGDAQVLAVAGHMHMLGTHVTIERTSSAGTTVLLDIPAWDFHWQGSYQLVQPIVIRADDSLTVRCRYDNTATHRNEVGHLGPVTDVQWGEGTQDEMCIGYVTIVDRAP